MTIEIVSPIYDNVDIRSWAQSIREIKIRELTEYVRNAEKIFELRKNEMHPYAYVKDKRRITELNKKLKTLINHKI